MNCKAFTLIELLVVVAIIGILAAVGVVAYNGHATNAKEKSTEINFRNINKSLIKSNPCNQGTVSISTPSKGNYSINYYSSSAKKISTHTIGTTWTPVKVSGYTTYTPVTINCTTTYKKVKITGHTTYTTIKP